MAQLPFITSLDFKTIISVDDVARVLLKLDEALAGSEFDALRNFNKTYLIITEHVQKAANNNRFDNAAFLSAFDAQFAKYYLYALRNYVAGQPVALAWRAAFDAALQPSDASPLKIMALGVNAHVNNDIPQVLIDCQANARHRSDYRLVNKIIGASLNEVIDNLQPHHALLSPKRTILQPIYKPAMKVLIRLWRYSAWRKFYRLSKHRQSVAQIEGRAYIISRGAQLLPL